MKIEFFNPFSKTNEWPILFMLCWKSTLPTVFMLNGFKLCYENYIQIGFFPSWFKYIHNKNYSLKIIIILGIAFGYFNKQS